MEETLEIGFGSNVILWNHYQFIIIGYVCFIKMD